MREQFRSSKSNSTKDKRIIANSKITENKYNSDLRIQNNTENSNLVQTLQANEYLSINKILLNKEPINVENSCGEYDPNLALKIVGNKGTYQKVALGISFWLQFALAIVMYTINYISRAPESFWCRKDGVDFKCSQSAACAQGGTIESASFENFTTKFQLQCSGNAAATDIIPQINQNAEDFTNNNMQIGYSIVFLAQTLSDFFGRKFMIKVIVISVGAVYTLIVIFYKYSDKSVYSFWILNYTFLYCWSVSNSLRYLQVILIAESCGYKSRVRNKSVAFLNVAYGLQCILMAAFASTFHDLESIFIYAIVMMLLSVPFALYLLKESPLYQFEWGQIKRFKQTLYTIAKINITAHTPNYEMFEDMIKSDELDSSPNTEKIKCHHKIVVIFKQQFCYRKNFTYLLCAFILSTFIEIFNHEIIEYFNQMIRENDLMLQEVLRGSCNFIASLVQIPIIEKIPRKTTLVYITLVLSILLYIKAMITYFVGCDHLIHKNWDFLFCVILLLLGVAVANVSLLYQIELLSTKMRATGIGLAAALGKIASIYYPKFSDQIKNHSVHPTTNLLIPSIIVVIYTLFMPETKYKKIN